MVALLSQDVALLDAKPVLFVNDDQPQFLEGDVLLDQCVCADGNHSLPCLNGSASHCALASAQAAGHEDGTNAKGF